MIEPILMIGLVTAMGSTGIALLPWTEDKQDSTVSGLRIVARHLLFAVWGPR